MTPTFNLQGLLEIAISETDSAAASLGKLNRQLQMQEQQFTLLLQYRADYQERLRRAIVNGVDSVALRNFNEFIARLEQAIAQQHVAVDQARRRAEHGCLQWQDKRRISNAFDTLSQRAAAAVMRTENSREQKAQDAFASRTARQKSLAER